MFDELSAAWDHESPPGPSQTSAERRLATATTGGRRERRCNSDDVPCVAACRDGYPACVSDQRSSSTVDLGRMARLVLVAAIVAALILVAVDNREDVRVGYVVGDTEAPIWIVLALAAVAGVMIGWLIKHRPHQH